MKKIVKNESNKKNMDEKAVIKKNKLFRFS